MWTELLFPDESTEKLDDIITGNLSITFGIDHKNTREKLAHLRQFREERGTAEPETEE